MHALARSIDNMVSTKQLERKRSRAHEDRMHKRARMEHLTDRQIEMQIKAAEIRDSNKVLAEEYAKVEEKIVQEMKNLREGLDFCGSEE